MTGRTAHCACGQLRAVTDGEPYVVSMCHCTWCQRRTGAPFGVGAYFRQDHVTLSGESRAWARPATRGELVNHFCPTCGTNLYWFVPFHAGGIGIAVGGFADPDFPAPMRSVWEDERHRWVTPATEDRFAEGSGGPRIR